MAGNGNEKKFYLSLAKKTAILLLCIYTMYVAAVFLVVPPLLKPRLEMALSDQIGRNVTIDEIKFNPFVLSATVANLRVHEKDGEPFFGFEQLFADIQLGKYLPVLRAAK